MYREDVLQMALRMTMEERQQSHGDPVDNHERIAAIWSVLLDHPITAHQAALCMAGVKLARIAHNPTVEDSFVDCAAYVAIAAECHHAQGI